MAHEARVLHIILENARETPSQQFQAPDVVGLFVWICGSNTIILRLDFYLLFFTKFHPSYLKYSQKFWYNNFIHIIR